MGLSIPSINMLSSWYRTSPMQRIAINDPMYYLRWLVGLCILFHCRCSLSTCSLVVVVECSSFGHDWAKSQYHLFLNLLSQDFVVLLINCHCCSAMTHSPWSTLHVWPNPTKLYSYVTVVLVSSSVVIGPWLSLAISCVSSSRLSLWVGAGCWPIVQCLLWLLCKPWLVHLSVYIQFS